MLSDEDLLMMQRNNEILRLMNNIAEIQLSLLLQHGESERGALKETLGEAKAILGAMHCE